MWKKKDVFCFYMTATILWSYYVFKISIFILHPILMQLFCKIFTLLSYYESIKKITDIILGNRPKFLNFTYLESPSIQNFYFAINFDVCVCFLNDCVKTFYWYLDRSPLFLMVSEINSTKTTKLYQISKFEYFSSNNIVAYTPPPPRNTYLYEQHMTQYSNSKI